MERGVTHSLGLSLLLAASTAGPALGADQAPGAGKADAVLIRNVRIFDGRSERLADGMDLLVVGNKIQTISHGPILPPGELTLTTIDAGGRVLMPGMIDTHTHLTMSTVPLAALLNTEKEYVGIMAAREAERTLMRGFTTVRDLGGPSFGVKRAIDEGQGIGPRIFPSGASITQTSGHGDYRGRQEPHRRWGGGPNPAERIGFAILADGVDEVLAATREQLRLGASQIKVMASGGVVSEYDPVDVVEYTDAELVAAVKAAADWGTYVTVHGYNPASIRRSIEAGVKSIEHGNLIDEPTIKLMAERGVFLSAQVLTFQNLDPSLGEERMAKARRVAAGLDNMFKLARRYGVKVTFGTDLTFSAKVAALEAKDLTARLQWFAPVECLRQSTSSAGELLALSGPRSPYSGKLGVVQEGALADLLVVDGNPLEDLKVLEDSENRLKLIMKDGKVYKNTLR